MASDDPGPDQLAFLGYDPHGVCDTHRDVDLHLCSTLGVLGDYCSMGPMDG